MAVATSRVAAPLTFAINVELAGGNASATERIECPHGIAKLLHKHGELPHLSIYFWIFSLIGICRHSIHHKSVVRGSKEEKVISNFPRCFHLLHVYTCICIDFAAQFLRINVYINMSIMN